ncbi:hypothetical protein CcaCcLH18_12996 [Colletotrichum camelliae]|nr:hypothetical protein CcaCcLH18_12996 [Colletotrichum camelliae]
MLPCPTQYCNSNAHAPPPSAQPPSGSKWVKVDSLFRRVSVVGPDSRKADFWGPGFTESILQYWKHSDGVANSNDHVGQFQSQRHVPTRPASRESPASPQFTCSPQLLAALHNSTVCTNDSGAHARIAPLVALPPLAYANCANSSFPPAHLGGVMVQRHAVLQAAGTQMHNPKMEDVGMSGRKLSIVSSCGRPAVNVSKTFSVLLQAKSRWSGLCSGHPPHQFTPDLGSAPSPKRGSLSAHWPKILLIAISFCELEIVEPHLSSNQETQDLAIENTASHSGGSLSPLMIVSTDPSAADETRHIDQLCPSWSHVRRRARDDTIFEIALGRLSEARS